MKPHDAVFAEVVRHGIENDCPVEPHEEAGIHEDIDETLPTVLAGLRAAAGSDRVVLVWGDDGQVTVHALEEVGFVAEQYMNDAGIESLRASATVPAFRLVAAGAAPLEPGDES